MDKKHNAHFLHFSKLHTLVNCWNEKISKIQSILKLVLEKRF